ncbi:MAG: pyridoxamine 5'-phosphate oxidase family protein [Egibacteraceae bacterium]
MTTIEEVLEGARRCVLALPSRSGPLLSPMAFWFDGAALWLSTSEEAVKARRLAREPACAVYVPARDGGGVAARGLARVHSLDDPVGLALHAPTVSAAMTALAVKELGAIGHYLRDLPAVPRTWRPRRRVALRVALSDPVRLAAPTPGPGVAPGLPAVVPADVRRAVAGRRRVVAAAGQADVALAPAVWSAGFALDVATPEGGGEGTSPFAVEGTPLAVVVDDDGGRPSQVRGLALRGTLRGGALAPERVTWWRGFEAETAEVPSPDDDVLTLPD